MKGKNNYIMAAVSAACMFVLIFDAKTAFAGAVVGVDLCIRTVIPSLFPFFFLCGIVNSFFINRSLKLLRPVGMLCGIPAGAESIFLIGITGGYPVGAQSISSAYSKGILNKNDAERMLGFCNNAGPAFLFGMTSLLFPTGAAPWLLWLIQILCALVAGMILPGKSTHLSTITGQNGTSFSQALQNAMKAIAAVCGWVVIFRVLIQILDHWLLWLFPAEFAFLLTGILELSNGCVALNELQSLPLRFITAAVITVFGGLCVGLQTVSVCQTLSCKMYFVGKMIQASVCIPLSMIAAAFLFPGNTVYLYIGLSLGACMTAGWIILRKSKIYTGNPVVYRV